MAQATLEVSTSKTESIDTELYRHLKRPEWGVGMVAWERDDTRGYQFEDGRLRIIKAGYYKLLEPAEDIGDRTEHIRDNLRRVITAGGEGPEPKVLERVCSFSDQVELFTRLYPKGFQDPEWVEDHRKTDGAPLKRHRTPISSEAREALSKDRCQAVLSSGGHEKLAQTMADILARTDLVSIAHAKALRGLEPDERRRYVESVVDLLHGERGDEERLKDHINVLAAIFGERPSWPVATVLPGLVYPDSHTVVRHSAFVRQAGSVAPTARYSRKATVRAYRNFRRVALVTRERLSTAGHEPRDLLDVYDFIWTTLRTSALERLGADD